MHKKFSQTRSQGWADLGSPRKFSRFYCDKILQKNYKTENFERQARHKIADMIRILRNLIFDGSIFDTFDKLISPPIFIF